MKKRSGSSAAAFKKASSGQSKEKYILRLYIAGTSPRSMRAISNIKEVCEINLKGSYTLEVIDLYQQPILAGRDQILATPTLIKRLPGKPYLTRLGESCP